MKGKQFAVLGLGRFGESIVRQLSEYGCNVLACDNNQNIVQELSSYATHVIQVDVTDEHAIGALGLGNFDVVVVAIGSNLEATIMATLIAKEKGAKYVVARAQNNMEKTILEKVGADRVILPEFEMGAKVATTLVTTNVIDFINLSDQFGIAEIEPMEDWVGISLSKSNIRASSGLNIVAIKRGKHIIVNPRAEEVIKDEDILVAIGETVDIQRYSGGGKEKIKSGGVFDFD